MMKKLIFYLLAAVCALISAPPAQAWTVYLDPDNVGDNPKIYLYGGSYGNIDWSKRTTMTKDEYGRWVYTSAKAVTDFGKAENVTPGYIIFLKSDDTQSKGDNGLSFSDGKTYTWDGGDKTTPTSATWNTYTIYFDATNATWQQLYFKTSATSKFAPVEMKTYMVDKDAAKGTAVDTYLYEFKFAAASTPSGYFYAGYHSGYNNEKTFSVSNIQDGHVYKATTQHSESDANNSVWNVSDQGEYNPVTVTGVELWKDGTAISKLTAAPYSWNLSGLTGAEKFLVKVYTAKADGTSASVTSYTASAGGTGLTSTTATNGFSIDSKVISATMTVTVEDNAATRYALTNTVNDAVTGVYLGSTKMNGSGSTYTLNGVTNATTGYTVKVTTTRNAAGTLYTVSGGSNLLAGDHNLTAGTAPFTVASSLATFNASVTVNTSTLAATGIKITDPNAVITAVKLVRCDGNQTLNFSTTDGINWIYRGDITKGGLNVTGTDKNYYLQVVCGGSTVDYALAKQTGFAMEPDQIFGQGYWSSSWYERGSNAWSFGFKDKDKANVTVVLNSDKTAPYSISYTDYAMPSAEVYMPLKRKDFFEADGKTPKPHYFLVGNRTGDWRLQPEWELTVNADGTAATLSGRLMYQQCFAIAKVDNYTDYTQHKYTVYTNGGYWVKSDAMTNIQLSSDGTAEGVRYDKVSTETHAMNKRLQWRYDKQDWSADTWTQTTPTLLKEVKVTLNSSKNPDKLSFTVSRDAADLGKARSLTLTGENIRYQGLFEFADGIDRDLSTMTPGSKQTKNSDDNSDHWGNHWVQTDDNGRPYVDGNGELLYCTAFDSNWLSKHQVNFYNAEKDVEYTSMSVTFLPADPVNEEVEEFKNLYKMHPLANGEGYNRIGNNESRQMGTVLKYNEAFADNFKDGRNYIDNSAWQCYVVKDMWMDGEFKIWTGWGGNLKKYNYVDDGKYDTAEQWFFENAGHQDINTTKVVTGSDITKTDGTVTVYPTRRDKEQANFKIDGMTYFSRVILWYNPTDGCENSVLQLVRSVFGPNIQAFPNLAKRNTLRYEWWIDTQDSDNDEVTVTSYTITRYKVVGGQRVRDRVVENNRTTNYAGKDAPINMSIGHYRQENPDGTITYINKIAYADDRNEIDPGRYQYKVEANFSNGTSKTAYSNVVRINESSEPVDVVAEQEMVDGNYTFNLKLTITPDENQLDKKVGEAEDAPTARDLMKYYIITVDDETYNRLENVKNSPLSFDYSYDDPQEGGERVLIGYENGEPKYLPDGTAYCKLEINKENPAVEFKWDNVVPNAAEDGSALMKYKYSNPGVRSLTDLTADEAKQYGFTVYLVSDDSDIAQWSRLNFNESDDATDIVAPSAELKVDRITLAKAVGDRFRHDPRTTSTHKDHLSGTRLRKVAPANPGEADGDDESYDDGDYKTENPIVYERLNEIVANAEITALPFDMKSIEGRGAVTYDLYMTHAGTSLEANLNNKAVRTVMSTQDHDSFGNECATMNPAQAMSVKFYDLDLVNLSRTTSADGTHDKVIDATLTGNYDSHILVSYLLDGDEYVNVSDIATKDIEFSHGIAAPEVRNNPVKYAKYESRYYHASYDDDEWHKNGGCGVDHPDNKPFTETLGYYAHAVIDFTIDGVDTDGKNGYVSFHVPQGVHNQNGCYAETDNWFKHQFTGTRAANGGAPAGAWAADFGVTKLSHNDVEFETYDKANDWKAANDWSTMAANARHLPIHVNPVIKYESQADYENNNFVAPAMQAKFSAIYPVIDTDVLTVEVLPSAAMLRAGEENPQSAEREFSNISLLGATSEVTVDWANAGLQTGVDDIFGDGSGYDADAPVEYYNLQGIRVVNPAKGQIYIMRQGATATKILVK